MTFHGTVDNIFRWFKRVEPMFELPNHARQTEQSIGYTLQLHTANVMLSDSAPADGIECQILRSNTYPAKWIPQMCVPCPPFSVAVIVESFGQDGYFGKLWASKVGNRGKRVC